MNDNLRPCVVAVVGKSGKIEEIPCWFHCWVQHANTVGESLMIGGPAAGQISYVLGLVEYLDGSVHQCYPADIRFTDREEGGENERTEND